MVDDLKEVWDVTKTFADMPGLRINPDKIKIMATTPDADAKVEKTMKQLTGESLRCLDVIKLVGGIISNASITKATVVKRKTTHESTWPKVLYDLEKISKTRLCFEARDRLVGGYAIPKSTFASEINLPTYNVLRLRTAKAHTAVQSGITRWKSQAVPSPFYPKAIVLRQQWHLCTRPWST